MKDFRQLLMLLVWLVPSLVIGGDEISEEELERWFNSDNFDPPRYTREVNEGALVFLAAPNKKAELHHHHNNMTIFPRSLQDGWVMMEQCHSNIDRVAAAQIVFDKDRVRDIRVTRYHNMEKAWVEPAARTAIKM